MIHEIGKTNSIFNQYMAEIRDKEIQKDSLRFRKNMERLANILGYEISKELDFENKEVTTVLGKTNVPQLKSKLVIASILRAGLTMHQALLSVFDSAENAFISAYREESENKELKIHVEYLACPDLTDKTVLLADPMIATGQSLVLVYQQLLKHGTPKQLLVAGIIASNDGMAYLKKHLPANTKYWVGAIDKELNDRAYIVPGLGDAGDLAFGKKI